SSYHFYLATTTVYLHHINMGYLHLFSLKFHSISMATSHPVSSVSAATAARAAIRGGGVLGAGGVGISSAVLASPSISSAVLTSSVDSGERPSLPRTLLVSWRRFSVDWTSAILREEPPL
ncbi:hypothetical protein PFISCL1PPCAC_21433, partial [Pristionchus fissidentatus]